jgi:hypothetical protein
MRLRLIALLLLFALVSCGNSTGNISATQFSNIIQGA